TAHSPLGLSGQEPSHPDVAHQRDRGRARGTVEPVDELLGLVRGRLVDLGVDVDWRLTDRRRRELLEHAAAWPTEASAVAAFVDAALASIERYGAPDYARAWITVWLELEPPALDVDEALCEEHPLAGIPVPRRACAQCRASQVAVSFEAQPLGQIG